MSREYHFTRSVARYTIAAIVLAALLRLVIVYAPHGAWLGKRGAPPPQRSVQAP